jgi:hypothetical protein
MAKPRQYDQVRADDLLGDETRCLWTSAEIVFTRKDQSLVPNAMQFPT